MRTDSVKEVINYINNSKSGDAKYYDENGSLIRTEKYFNDNRYDKRSFYWFSVALCFSFILFSKNVNAQLKTDIENLKEKYTKHDLVRWQKELNIDIGLENDNIVITQNSIDEDLFLNESATQYSKESVSYSTFFR